MDSLKIIITTIIALVLLGLQVSVFLPKGSTEKFIKTLGNIATIIKWGLLVGLLIVIGIVGLIVPAVGSFLYVAALFLGMCWVIGLVTHSREFQALDHRIARWTDEELEGNDK
jgi:hypothetical protein